MSSSTAIIIGGDKGHVVEEVDNATFIKLFKHYRWKMIPNCTGRYTCRDHKVVSHLEPVNLLQQAGVVAISQQLRQWHDNSDSVCTNEQQRWEQQSFHDDVGAEDRITMAVFRQYHFNFPCEKRKDSIFVVPFDECNQIGLITYVKESKNKYDTCGDEGNPKRKSFVHTLNSRSGFQRKLEAIGINANRRGLIQEET